jgi:hypothetical protein
LNNDLIKKIHESERDKQIPIPERFKLFNNGDIVKLRTDKVGKSCEELVVIGKTQNEIICSSKGQKANYSPDELNTAGEYNYQKQEEDERIQRNYQAILDLNN